MSIFDRVASFFGERSALATDRSGEFPFDLDLWVATVVLMLEIAYGDAEFSPPERRTIRRAIEREFGIGRRDALELMDSAERSRARIGSLEWVGQEIRSRYDLDQRKRVVALLWKVALADRSVEEVERVFTESVIELVGLTREQGREAVELAERGGV